MSAEEKSILDWKKSGRLTLCIGVSAICLYLALQGIDLIQAVQSLQKTDAIAASGAVLFLFLSFGFRAWRWHYLLLPLKRVRVIPLFRSTMIGFMANYLLPFRTGEFIRAVSIGQAERISKAGAMGSIVIERIVDGITLSLIPLVLMSLLDFPRWITEISLVLLGTYVGGLGFIVLVEVNTKRTWLKLLTGFLPTAIAARLSLAAFHLLDGMRGLNECRAIVPVGLLSLLCWFCHGMYFFLLFRGMNLDLSIGAALVLQTVIAIGVMLPAAPAYLGNFEYFTVLGLSFFGVNKDEAFAYSLLAHGLKFFPVTLAGLLFAFKSGFRRPMETEVTRVITPSL